MIAVSSALTHGKGCLTIAQSSTAILRIAPAHPFQAVPQSSGLRQPTPSRQCRNPPDCASSPLSGSTAILRIAPAHPFQAVPQSSGLRQLPPSRQYRNPPDCASSHFAIQRIAILSAKCPKVLRLARRRPSRRSINMLNPQSAEYAIQRITIRNPEDYDTQSRGLQHHQRLEVAWHTLHLGCPTGATYRTFNYLAGHFSSHFVWLAPFRRTCLRGSTRKPSASVLSWNTCQPRQSTPNACLGKDSASSIDGTRSWIKAKAPIGCATLRSPDWWLTLFTSSMDNVMSYLPIASCPIMSTWSLLLGWLRQTRIIL